MEDDEVNLKKFITSRETEIKKLEEAIKTSRKKTLLFQRLPFYKRRRSRSNKEIKKKKSQPRRKDRHILRTHVWYAKRFKMIKVNEIGLPYKRNVKSDKYIYKSNNRGFVFDETFKKISIYLFNSKIYEKEGVDHTCLYKIQSFTFGNEIIECILTEKYFILSYIDNEQVNLWLSINFERVKEIDCSFMLLNSINGELKEFLELCSQNIEEKIEKDEIFFIKELNNQDNGKVFINRNEVMKFWNKLILLKVIPLSIKELQRFAVENNSIIYPFDYANSYFYKFFENALNSEIIDKYKRTPKGKKVNLDLNDLYIWTNRSVQYHVFELEKGSLKTKAFVLQDNVVIGRVIRSDFCFTRGKCRGLCYIFSEIDILKSMYCKNIEDGNIRPIEIIKSL